MAGMNLLRPAHSWPFADAVVRRCTLRPGHAPGGVGGGQFSALSRLQVPASASSARRLRHDRVLPAVLKNASDLDANRLGRTHAGAAKNVSTTVRDVSAGPVWELHDEENADPASASRATARASRRGNALVKLPDESSGQNARRKRLDDASSNGSSEGSASDSTPADQPRKKARYDLAGLGFPALSTNCKAFPGIDYRVGQQPHYRPDKSGNQQWTDVWNGKAFPELINTSVPANVDANVGNAPVRRKEDGLPLCRLAACNRSKCTYFCQACYKRYLKVNQLYAEKMERLHAEKVRAGDTVAKTLRRHLLDQSFDAETVTDADVHLADKKMLFHFTAANFLDHWECNNAGEILLKPNKYLKRETLDEHTPHWPNMPLWKTKKEGADPKVWATTSFLCGWKFLADHHGCPPEKGTVWHVLVFTWRNGAYKTFRQHRYNGVNISPNHELMCESPGRDAVPCLVLRLEFQDEDIESAKMAVVRVNGDGATAEDIDAEDPGFKITEEKISWSR